MTTFLELDNDSRKSALELGAQASGKPAFLLEKDFWIVWALEKLFSLDLASTLAFKGGTSLSKVYGVIDRFSEDIDITVDKAHLGYPKEAPSSSNGRKRALEAAARALEGLIETTFLPALSVPGVHAESDPEDSQTILLTYPGSLDPENRYVAPRVKIEFGARNPIEPSARHRVVPELSHHLQELGWPSAEINVLAGSRTFWEKATLLHQLYHYPAEKLQAKRPERMARHYYDLVQLAGHPEGEKALGKDLHLLARVAEDKTLFYPSKWARYDLARAGTLRLVPPPELESILAQDYESMISGGMFYEEPPAWSEVLERVAALEQRVNQLASK